MSRPAQLFWLIVNLLLGLLPSGAFLFWVERNTSLPWLPIELGWPWVSLWSESLPVQILWNLGLFAFFAALHTGLAQHRVHSLLARFVPPQAIRTLYMTVTGLTLTLIMGCWQQTGILVWTLPLGLTTLNVLSMALFLAFMTGMAMSLARFDAAYFFGIRQILQKTSELSRSEGQPVLEESGFFGIVRHPIYFFTLAAMLITPMMGLDRMIVFLASAAYLAIGIPIEERKLIQLFGTAYREYRKRVPAVLPWLRSRRSSFHS